MRKRIRAIEPFSAEEFMRDYSDARFGRLMLYLLVFRNKAADWDQSGNRIAFLDQLPKDSPAQCQVFSALETFQASIFNVLNGWYRIAGVCLQCALEDMLLGLYYQNRPADTAEYEKVANGSERSPGLRDVFEELKKHGASHGLTDRLNALYHSKLSVHVHRRSDGKIWSSNRPIYVPGAFRAWLSEFRDTYSLLCEVIDVTIPGTAVAQIGENHLKVAPFKTSQPFRA